MKYYSRVSLKGIGMLSHVNRVEESHGRENENEHENIKKNTNLKINFMNIEINKGQKKMEMKKMKKKKMTKNLFNQKNRVNNQIV